MKTFQKRREYLKKLQDNFLDAKIDNCIEVYILTNIVFILSIAFIISYASILLFYTYDFSLITYISIAIPFLVAFFCLLNENAFMFILPLSQKLLYFFFGKYGRVVTRNDWKKIKKISLRHYLYLSTRFCFRYCYFSARALAMYLDDAQLMYCRKPTKTNYTGHCVIVKNHCVYDTNLRRHYDLDDYIEIYEIKVYKIFTEQEFRQSNFFDVIRNDFVQWCEENDAYCDPE